MAKQMPTLQPMEDVTAEQVEIPKGPVAHGKPMPEQGKSDGSSSREKLLCADCNPPVLPAPLGGGRGVWNKGGKLNLEEGGGKLLF